jgi:hypothetical protein
MVSWSTDELARRRAAAVQDREAGFLRQQAFGFTAAPLA